MKICGIVLVILYAGLMLFAVLKEKEKSITSVLIGIGGLLGILYALLSVIQGSGFILILILGMLCISGGALLNGIRQKNVHIRHHIVRLAVETAIVAACWIWV